MINSRIIRIGGGLFFVAAVALLLTGEPLALATEGEALVNRWACGLDDNCTTGGIDDGWTHNQYVSEQTCCKAPNPADPTIQGGQAFKNGPKNGAGQAGYWSVSQQVFALEDRGIAAADTYTVAFQTMIISQADDATLIADLYTDSGVVNVLTHHRGDTPTDTSPYGGFDLYAGAPVQVEYSTTYTLEIRTIYTGTVSTLGIKWTGLSLWFEGQSEPTETPTPSETPTETATPTPTETPTETPTPTETNTPTPTETPTETPTPSATPTATSTPMPLSLEPGYYQIVCPGLLIFDAPYVLCEGNE